MKRGVMLVNTSRGGLVDSRAVIAGLKSGRIGALGLDVYEEETDLFSRDLSGQIIQDDVFSRLLTFPNVIVTAHQGFFTAEALHEIATTTLANVTEFERAARSSTRSASSPASTTSAAAARRESAGRLVRRCRRAPSSRGAAAADGLPVAVAAASASCRVVTPRSRQPSRRCRLRQRCRMIAERDTEYSRVLGALRTVEGGGWHHDIRK